MTHDPSHPLQFDDPWRVEPAPTKQRLAAEAEERAFAPCGPVQLRDVVDMPARSLFVDYKSWRNLRHPEDQAEVARDIAAIANMGGGAIAFGFDEDTLAPCDTHPFRTAPDKGTLAALLATFLDPPPACEMLVLRSARNEEHLVIRIGGHGATPIFVRTHGLPPGAMGLVQAGALYVRRHAAPRKGQIAPRIESAPVSMPAEWLPLIRRCVRAEREPLLGAIEAVLEGRRCAPALAAELRVFHEAARARFLALAASSPRAERLVHWHCTLSYALERDRDEALEPAQMPEMLSRILLAVQQEVRNGQPLFEPPCRGAARPRFSTDPAMGEPDAEFLETAWLLDKSQTTRADLWRVSPRGLASIARPYAEDDPDLNAAMGLTPGTWLSPNKLARDLSELVLHARALVRLFGSAKAVLFRCEWHGLAGRRLHDPGSRWIQSAAALADQRVVTLRVPVASLAGAWPETVSQLMAPLLRMIEPDLALGADWVRAEVGSIKAQNPST